MSTNTTPEKTVSPKVTSSAIVTLLASLAIALLNGLVADSAILGGLPPAVQFVIILGIPPVLTFLAGYRTTDPLRVRR